MIPNSRGKHKALTFPLLEGFILNSNRKEVKPCENCYRSVKLQSLLESRRRRYATIIRLDYWQSLNVQKEVIGSTQHMISCVYSVSGDYVRWGCHLTASRRFSVNLMLSRKSCSGMHSNHWFRSLPRR